MKRREFLKLVGAVGLAAVIPVGLFAGEPVNDREVFEIGDIFTINGYKAPQSNYLQHFAVTNISKTGDIDFWPKYINGVPLPKFGTFPGKKICVFNN